MNSIDIRVEKMIQEFKDVSDWEERYKKLISMGKAMKDMPEDLKIEANKVKGCQSQVWLHAKLVGDKVNFEADSDATIVKGIIALLVHIYTNSTPEEILKTKPDFLDEIGLRQHLSMSRANGLSSMVKQISIYALAFQTKIKMGL